MFIYKAGVIGAGAMGSGIAQVISFSGLPVVLKDTDMDRVNKGIEMLRKVYQGRVDKGKMTPSEMDQKMKLVIQTTPYHDFKHSHLHTQALSHHTKSKH